MPSLVPVISFFVVVVALLAVRQRREIARTWQNRRLFSSLTFWGVGTLYALSGAAITFSSFGAAHLGMSAMSASMQILAVAGLLLFILMPFVARRLAAPVFEQNAISQNDRRHFHALWISFWIPGILVGLLPAVIRA